MSVTCAVRATSSTVGMLVMTGDEYKPSRLVAGRFFWGSQTLGRLRRAIDHPVGPARALAQFEGIVERSAGGSAFVEEPVTVDPDHLIQLRVLGDASHV